MAVIKITNNGSDKKKITNIGSNKDGGDDDSSQDHIPEIGGRSLKGGGLRQISTNTAHRTFVD